MNIAAKVRAHKETHPEMYCAVRGCLWRTATQRGPNPCLKHSGAVVSDEHDPQRIDELCTNLAHSLKHGSAPCTWCHDGLAGPDGFCSRMCRVESWKANGDESAFLPDRAS